MRFVMADVYRLFIEFYRVKIIELEKKKGHNAEDVNLTDEEEANDYLIQ